ncbi:hypothetical protein COX94_01030, partial [Candidatus Nomurabacteria bacterium CG_4_10_14_0_2_um_filter_33_9]
MKKINKLLLISLVVFIISPIIASVGSDLGMNSTISQIFIFAIPLSAFTAVISLFFSKKEEPEIAAGKTVSPIKKTVKLVLIVALIALFLFYISKVFWAFVN